MTLVAFRRVQLDVMESQISAAKPLLPVCCQVELSGASLDLKDKNTQHKISTSVFAVYNLTLFQCCSMYSVV